MIVLNIFFDDLCIVLALIIEYQWIEIEKDIEGTLAIRDKQQQEGFLADTFWNT